MPTISKNNIRINHKEIVKDYSITVMYSQDLMFYAVIPDEFKAIVRHLDDEQRNNLFIKTKYKTAKDRHQTERAHDSIVHGTSEGECITRIRKCLEEIVGKSITQVKVIIVFYNPTHNTRYNKEHPQIGFQFGLTYAIETSLSGKKVYSTYNEYDSFGETKLTRHELNLWNQAAIIIPDTEANRETLEYLYNAMKALNEKLASFTSTPDKLLEFIASNIKLISQ